MMSVDSVANSYKFNGLSSKVLLFYEIVILVKNGLSCAWLCERKINVV